LRLAAALLLVSASATALPGPSRYEGFAAWRGPTLPDGASQVGVIEGGDRLFVLPSNWRGPRDAERLPGVGPWPTGRVFIDVPDADPSRVARDIGARFVRRVGRQGWALIDVGPTGVRDVARRLSAHHDVMRWDIDRVRRFDVRQAGPHFPDDALFGHQWHLHNTGQRADEFPGMVAAGSDIGAPAAWALGTGDADVIIAVLDTGFDHGHPDFDEERVVSPANFTSAGPPDATPPAYEYGAAHGTAVAGLATASQTGATGTVGVCPGCSLMPIRIFDAISFGTDTSVVDGFDHALSAGADVVNNSWGYGAEAAPAPVLDAIGDLVELGRDGLGAVVVFAVGNSYDEAPASEIALDPRVLAVGGTGSDDYRVAYSTWGEGLDLMAPTGHDLLFDDTTFEITLPAPQLVTADRVGDDGYNPDEIDGYDPLDVATDYTTMMSGTSGAAPIVAGVVGLALSHGASALTWAQVFSLLADNAQHVGDVTYEDGWHPFYGRGRVSASAVLSSLAAGAPVCQPQPEACDDGVDNDCDLSADDEDDDCGFELPAPGVPYGEACDPFDTDECGDGWCFASGFETDGVCTTTCVASACQEGVCVETGENGFSFPVCLLPCAGGCESGTTCLTVDGEDVCYPRCDAPESFCPVGMPCDPGSGRCGGGEEPPPPPPPPPPPTDGGAGEGEGEGEGEANDPRRRTPSRVVIAAPANCAQSSPGGGSWWLLTLSALATLARPTRRRARAR
jgi:subtilisin family serine protease